MTAAGRTPRSTLGALVCMLLCASVCMVNAASEFNLQAKEVDYWVSQLSENFKDLRSKLGVESLERRFKDHGVKPGARNQAHGQRLMATIRARIEKFMYRKEEHVERIRMDAELSFASHVHRNYSMNCDELRNQPFLRATAIEDVDEEKLQRSAKVNYTEGSGHSTVHVVPRTESKENECSKSTPLDLTKDPRAYGVKTSRKFSTAHVPSNIYDASTAMLNVANWSNSLDQVFAANAASDPMLKWQYFGSTEGMMKIYPGIRWYIQTKDLVNKDVTIDFFDCRTQYWFTVTRLLLRNNGRKKTTSTMYLLAATYPKDMVILVDNSGSMKGRRSIIANMTLTELLYTMNVNDYFNVIMFMNSSLKYISDSYNFTMLQATEKNKYTMMDLIREDEDKPASERRFAPLGISEYKGALEEAFELLRYVKRNATHLSSGGVQNIVLISDGAPQSFQEVFQRYNPDRQVRVFTFLVGHDAAEEENVKRIACSNRGYFVQISTLSDVKENVQRYIPVMARTNAHIRDHFFAWTGVHRNQIKTQNPNTPRIVHTFGEASSSPGGGGAKDSTREGAGDYTVFPFPDPTAATMTSTTSATTANAAATSINGTRLGGKKSAKSGPKITISYKNSADTAPHQSPEEDPAVKNRLFVSVAQAAYDVRDNETINKGIGRLIGVAGLDVPTEHFERLGPAWELGALGYIFMVTNNGHVLFHPEFRPFDSEGNLRLFFNNRDIAEIERPSDAEPLYNAPSYDLPLRLSLINRLEGITELERVKTYEDYTRSFRREFKYFYGPINSTGGLPAISRATPFSMALALPWKRGQQWPPPLDYATGGGIASFPPNGASRDYIAQLLYNATATGGECRKVAASAGVYRVGLSDYEFCEFPSDLLAEYNNNPVCALAKVLAANVTYRRRIGCSEEYLRRVFVDAEVTLDAVNSWAAVDNATLLSSGIGQFYLWTNTGLSRWYNRTQPLQPDFVVTRRGGSREEIYEKTVLLSVEAAEEIPASSSISMSVFTVPASERVMTSIKSNDSFPRAFPVQLTSLVRVRSVGADSSELGSPVAIAGMELDYAKLEETFNRVTNGCSDASDTACVSCTKLNIQCYLLDRSGFLVVSETREDVGKSFDQINCAAMQTLVEQGFFERVRTYDYQAICSKVNIVGARSASTLQNPFRSAMRFTSWLILQGFLLLSDMANFALHSAASLAEVALVLNEAPAQPKLPPQQQPGDLSSLSQPTVQLTPKQCAAVEQAKPRRMLRLREEIDSRVETVLAKVYSGRKEYQQPQQKTGALKTDLIQPYCIQMEGDTQEACAHLCRRLKSRLHINLFADLLGNCPKRVVKELDCVKQRDLVLRRPTAESGAKSVSASAARSCSGHFGYCPGTLEGCPTGTKAAFKVHSRDVPHTNLVFVAVEGDPNCKCSGCSDTIRTERLQSGPENYTAPRLIRVEPPWGMKEIVLRDNSTVCSKRASVPGPSRSHMQLILAASSLLVSLLAICPVF